MPLVLGAIFPGVSALLRMEMTLPAVVEIEFVTLALLSSGKVRTVVLIFLFLSRYLQLQKIVGKETFMWAAESKKTVFSWS